MQKLKLILVLSICGALPALAQEACEFFSDAAADKLAKALSHAKSCSAAAAKLHDCAWGSSADTQFAPIVITKCEKTFLDKLSSTAKNRYFEEMQLCAYKFARLKGTMYMSEAALCQVDVALHFASKPQDADLPSPRASFDCGKAQTVLEKAICSDIRLGHADIILSRLNAEALKGADKKERAAWIQTERQWRRSVSAKCGLSQMPPTEKSLNCLRNEFELRFAEDLGGDEDVESASVSQPRASFDCEKPSSGLEIVICADAELGQADIKLAQAYHEARETMKMQHQDLVKSERQWLRFVSGYCPLGVVGGIPPLLTRACLRTVFEERITQLQTCPQKEPTERISCLNDFRPLEKKP